MKKTIFPLAALLLFFCSCNNNASVATVNADSASTPSVDPSKDWKFGVALWTFHTFPFMDGLDKADSAGISYIEPNTFSKAGPEFKDSAILSLSAAGIER